MLSISGSLKWLEETMGILSNNPIAQYEVEQEWNCWPWSWNDDRDAVVKIGSALMEALGQDWEFWSDTLKHIAAMACYGDYASPEQVDRGVDGMQKLIKIIHTVTGGARGMIMAHSNPSGGYRVSPEFQIKFGDPDNFQSFLFRMNEIKVIRNGAEKWQRPAYPIQRFIPQFKESNHSFNNRARLIYGEIKWSCNGEIIKPYL